MIRVQTWDEPDGAVGIRLDGHSEPDNDRERVQVCAACSALMGNLTFLLDGDTADAEDLDGTGWMKVIVPNCELEIAKFVVASFIIIANNYPGHIELNLGDSSLPNSRWLHKARSL